MPSFQFVLKVIASLLAFHLMVACSSGFRSLNFEDKKQIITNQQVFGGTDDMNTRANLQPATGGTTTTQTQQPVTQTVLQIPVRYVCSNDMTERMGNLSTRPVEVLLDNGLGNQCKFDGAALKDYILKNK